MCTLPFNQLCITATGEVALCCADWYAEAGLGNVNDHSLLDIWFSPEFISYRDSLSLQQSCAYRQLTHDPERRQDENIYMPKHSPEQGHRPRAMA